MWRKRVGDKIPLFQTRLCSILDEIALIDEHTLIKSRNVFWSICKREDSGQRLNVGLCSLIRVFAVAEL